MTRSPAVAGAAPIPVTRRSMLRGAVAGAAAIAAAAGGLLATSPAADAATGTPIVYRLQGTATGKLDGVSFTNALVTMKQVTNTADVVGGNGEFTNRVGKVTVTVAGVGTDTLTYGTSFLDQYGFYPGNSAAFGFDGANEFRFVVKNSQLSSYDLQRPFGPLSGPTYVDPNRGAATSRGGLLLTSAGTATFKAYSPK